MTGFIWNAKKPNGPQAVTPEPRNAQTDKKAPDTMRPVDSVMGRSAACLGPSLHVRGDITGTEDLLIDGSVEGMIHLDERKLTVGTAAKLKADIDARDVVVFGCVQGNVHATGRIEIKKGGSVIGDLRTAQVMIDDGADFKGSIEIDRSGEAEKKVHSRAALDGAMG